MCSQRGKDDCKSPKTKTYMCERCWPPAQAVYLAERERRVADSIDQLRQTLDPAIVYGLESIEEPGHTESARLRRWPSMLEYAADLHSRVRALDGLRVELPNFDSYGQQLSDEELDYLLASSRGFLAQIAKLQAEIQSWTRRLRNNQPPSPSISTVSVAISAALTRSAQAIRSFRSQPTRRFTPIPTTGLMRSGSRPIRSKSHHCHEYRTGPAPSRERESCAAACHCAVDTGAGPSWAYRPQRSMTSCAA
jgi:hypothetical protein